MRGTIVQVAATFIVSQGNYLTGYCVAWSSYALEVLGNDHGYLGMKITKEASNLIGSLPMLGHLLATFVAVWLADSIGRKRTTLLGGLFYVLSWSIITSATTVPTILIGRFIIGIANGLHEVVCIPFISELAAISLIGTLSSILTTLYCFGILMAYITGWFCSYDVVNYINLMHSVVYAVLVGCLKDTPASLLARGKEMEALKSLKFYRGSSTTTQEVLNELEYFKSLRQLTKVKHTLTDPGKCELHPADDVENSEDSDMSALKVLCKSKPYQRALVLSIVNMLLLVFGGTIAVVAYAEQLFHVASPDLSAHACSVALAISFAAGSLLATVVCDLVGRRTLMMTSSILSFICLALLAAMLQFPSWFADWMVLAAVLTYCFCLQAGIAVVPYVQLAEQFPPKLKGLTSMIAASVSCIANFIVLVLFGPVSEKLGLGDIFYIFSGVCAGTAVVTYFFMRETRGVPLDVIQKMYEDGYRYRKYQGDSKYKSGRRPC